MTWLKIAAMVAMLSDHVAVAYLQTHPSEWLEPYLRMPGRISIPIFAFLVAYGYEHYSKARARYALWLWLFAVAAEPIYIAFFGKSGNALVPLALGATILLLSDRATGWVQNAIPLLSIALVSFFSWTLNDVSLVPIVGALLLFHRIIRHGQWAIWLPVLALCISMCNNWEWQYLAMIPVTLGLIAMAVVMPAKLPAFRIPKLVGYGFYPAHLTILAMLVSALSA